MENKIYPDFGYQKPNRKGRWHEGVEHVDDDDSLEEKIERTTY